MLIFHLYADIYATFLFLEWFDILEVLKKKNGKRDRGKKDDTHTHVSSRSWRLSPSFGLFRKAETKQDKTQNRWQKKRKTDGHNFGQFQSRQNDVDPSDVTFRPRGIFEKHVEESIFNQIGSAAAVHFVRPASCGYFMQSSLTKKKNINKKKSIRFW